MEVLYICLYVRDHSDRGAGLVSQWSSCQMWSWSLHELTILCLEQDGAEATRRERGTGWRSAFPGARVYDRRLYSPRWITSSCLGTCSAEEGSLCSSAVDVREGEVKEEVCI